MRWASRENSVQVTPCEREWGSRLSFYKRKEGCFLLQLQRHYFVVRNFNLLKTRIMLEAIMMMRKLSFSLFLSLARAHETYAVYAVLQYVFSTSSLCFLLFAQSTPELQSTPILHYQRPRTTRRLLNSLPLHPAPPVAQDARKA